MLLVDEPTFATLEPVSLDHNENNNDRDSSPLPLVIDADKETFCSQSVLSDYFPRREPIGQRLPRRTLNDKVDNGLSSNSSRFTTDANHLPNGNRLENTLPHEENR